MSFSLTAKTVSGVFVWSFMINKTWTIFAENFNIHQNCNLRVSIIIIFVFTHFLQFVMLFHFLKIRFFENKKRFWIGIIFFFTMLSSSQFHKVCFEVNLMPGNTSLRTFYHLAIISFDHGMRTILWVIIWFRTYCSVV